MKTPSDMENLTRSIQDMPVFVRAALHDNGMMPQYDLRPAYQRNDYLSWINRAVRDATKQKRLAQMIDELTAGNAYMGMKWNG